MKIRCPKCKTEIELGVSKFPPAGIEVNCPSCEAKFRLKSKGKSKAAKAPEDTPAPVSEPEAAAPPTPEAAPAPAPAPEPAAAAPEPAPAADADDDFDDLADLFDEIDQLSDDEPPPSMYFVRGQTGKVFGPLTIDAVEQMLKTGQLKGTEDTSTDKTDWQPMGDWPDFANVVPAPSDDDEEGISWEDNSAEPPAEEAPVRAARPAPARPAAPRPMATPSARPMATAAPSSGGHFRPSASTNPASPVALPEEPIEAPEQPAPSARRIRTALKDEVLENEENAGKINLKDPKIIGGGAFLIVLLLGTVVFLLLPSGGPSKKDYPVINMSFQQPFAIDSHKVYLGKLLPNINGKLRKYPGHPQLLVYKGLVLAMYLEHYGFDKAKRKALHHAIKKLPKESKAKAPFHHTWLLAQQALLQRNAGNAIRYGKQMLKKRANHSGALYIQAKAASIAGRKKQAVKLFDKLIQRMSEPARVYFAKGLTLTALAHNRIRQRQRKPSTAKGKKKKTKGKKGTPTKRKSNVAPKKKAATKRKPPKLNKVLLEEGFQAFYQATLITKEHYPALLAMLKAEAYLPMHKAKFAKAWDKLSEQMKSVKDRQAKGSFYLMRFHRSRKEGDAKQALGWLKAAAKTGFRRKQINRQLPDAYLATYDYPVIWNFLKKRMKPKRKPGQKKRKLRFEPGSSTVFLQVLLRMKKYTNEEARPWPRLLKKYCKRCRDSYKFWYWRGRFQEAINNYSSAISSYKRSLNVNPGAMAAVAGLARMYAQQSNQKMLNKMLERLQNAKIVGLTNGLSAMELWHSRKKYQKVVEIGTKLLKERQDDEFLNRLVGLSYLALDKPNKAKEHLSRSLKILRKDSSALFGLGIAFEKLEQPDKAFKLYQDNLKLKRNDAKTQYRMGRIYYNQKQYEKAITYLKKSVEQEDRNADAHFYLGRAYEDGKGLKDRESYKIRESYERSIQLAPNNRVYLYRLARYYYKSRQSGKALTIYTKLLRTPNQTNKQKADIYFERGKLLFEERSWRGALRDFMTVKRLDKEYPGIHLRLGDCYREMRRLGQAMSSYKKALAILKKAEPDKDDPAQALKRKAYDKQSAQLNGYIADIYRDRRNSGMAIRYYRKAISFNPKDYRYHRRIGYLYKDKRRWSACRRHLTQYLKLAPTSQLAVDRSEVTNDLRGCR